MIAYGGRQPQDAVLFPAGALGRELVQFRSPMAHALDVRLDGSVATVGVPETIDPGFAAALASTCEALAADDAVRCLVVTGASAAFCRGWQSIEGVVSGDPFGCLADLPKPVVAALNGEASGGGLALALACDIRIASDDAVFALPEVEAGAIPAAGATQRLARLVGRGNALQLILTGDRIGAAEALRMGLVSEVVAADALAGRARAIAARIAERGPLAEQFAKEAVARGIDMTLEQALRFETDLTIILQTTEDRAEGVRAFREKRKPEFKGR